MTRAVTADVGLGSGPEIPFDPAAPLMAEVPDPYYGDDEGFTEVLDMVQAAVPGLLDWVRANRGGVISGAAG